MIRTRPRREINVLYHLAELANLPSILQHGLLSTERLLPLTGLSEAECRRALREHRPDCRTLPGGLIVRDQKPMPPKALAPALEDGLSPADWYALINGFVFFWADRHRLDRQRGACKRRPQAVLVFDGARLLRDFGSDCVLSPINSGNARRRAARRGLGTLVPYHAWLATGFAEGLAMRPREPAEVLFRCPIPARHPYLMAIEREDTSDGLPLSPSKPRIADA